MSLLSRLFARRPLPAPEPSLWRGVPLPPVSGVTVNADTALSYSAVWACVQIISETVAHLPWHLYVVGDRGARIDDRPGAARQIGRLLAVRPNPDMTAFSFRQLLLADALLWGNGYALIYRNQRGAAELWPLHPSVVRPKYDDGGRLVYDIVDAEGGQHRYPADAIFHLHGLGFDGLVGYPVIRYAARSIGLGIAAETYGATFFGNGASIGGVLTTDQPLTDDQRAAVAKMLEEKYRGPERAHRTLVLSHGTKFEQTAIPPEDAQFLETRKFQTTEICRWFRVPPHKVGDLERATFSNIEHQSIEFVTDTILPWVRRLEQEADYKLIELPAGIEPHNSARRFTRFALEGLLRGDSKSRGEFYKLMREIGVYSVNDILEFEDRNTIGPEGDKRLAPMNFTTLERIGEEKTSLSPPAPPDGETNEPEIPERSRAETAGATPRYLNAAR